jgi:signal transduction histidine kinase
MAIQGPRPLTLLAAGVAGLAVLGYTVVPLTWHLRSFVADGIAFSGALLTVTAVTITGSADSPYLLLSITPTVWAGLYGGLRMGLATALLSSGTLFLTDAAQRQPDASALISPEILVVSGVQILIAGTVAQVRRLLIDLGGRQRELDASKAATARLQGAHDLLTRLADLTAGEDISPIALGNAALETITANRPGSAARAVLMTARGPLLVAKNGPDVLDAFQTAIPLNIGGKEVGSVVLLTLTPLTETEKEDIETSLQPLALSFANVNLLQTIASRAITEERIRIARELHDDLGPSLASLGLALDVALLQDSVPPTLADHLSELRRNVGHLVSDVRNTVADLRSQPQEALASALLRLTAVDGPEVHLALDERRPPGPALATDLTALVSEALRNAIRHSAATSVKVEGFVDYDHGQVTVSDNGRGFDPGKVPSGHYGLVGMSERARRMGARLSINSGASGTSVTIEWGDR